MLQSVQFSHSVVSYSLQPHEPQHTRPPSPSPTPGVYSNSYPLSLSDVIQSAHPLLSLLFLLSIILSTRIFPNELALHIGRPKYWSFSFSISPSNEYSGLVSFTINWLDLLAVQGTLKSLLQHQVQNHQFFSAQLSLWSNSHIHI